MRTFFLTPAAGKRLIAKAVLSHPLIQDALGSKTLVVIAGTTNGTIAEELVQSIGAEKSFSKKKFFRGITLPPQKTVKKFSRTPEAGETISDLIISKGIWQKKKTIFDIVDDLHEGDIILKGANALNLVDRQAAILIEHPKGGTIAAAIQAVIGRRVRLIIPCSLEKRVTGDLNALALKTNAPGHQGPRLMPVPGEILTEIEAIHLLTGAQAELIAAGGVDGAEGGVWLSASGSQDQLDKLDTVIEKVRYEPSFALQT